MAPPRAAHQRFGGPLSDAEFYGDSGYVCLTTVQPPFVTYANYVVGVHQAAGAVNGPANVGSGTGGLGTAGAARVSALLPQSAGRLVGLTRPTERFTPLAEKKPTGRPPMILEFLATLTSVKQAATAGEAIEVRAGTKRKREADTAGPAPIEQANFLKRYVKKPATAAE